MEGGRDVERRTLLDPWRGAVCTVAVAVAVGAAAGTGLEEVSKPHSPKPQASRLQTADSGQEQVQVQVQTSPLHHRSIWRRVVTCGRRPTFVPVGTHVDLAASMPVQAAVAV